MSAFFICVLPSPRKIIFVAASVYIFASTSTPSSCVYLIFCMVPFAFSVPLPNDLLASAIIKSIAATRKAAEPVAKSITLEFLSMSRIFAIAAVI